MRPPTMAHWSEAMTSAKSGKEIEKRTKGDGELNAGSHYMDMKNNIWMGELTKVMI